MAIALYQGLLFPTIIKDRRHSIRGLHTTRDIWAIFYLITIIRDCSRLSNGI